MSKGYSKQHHPKHPVAKVDYSSTGFVASTWHQHMLFIWDRFIQYHSIKNKSNAYWSWELFILLHRQFEFPDDNERTSWSLWIINHERIVSNCIELYRIVAIFWDLQDRQVIISEAAELNSLHAELQVGNGFNGIQKMTIQCFSMGCPIFNETNFGIFRKKHMYRL